VLEWRRQSVPNAVLENLARPTPMAAIITPEHGLWPRMIATPFFGLGRIPTRCSGTIPFTTIQNRAPVHCRGWAKPQAPHLQISLCHCARPVCGKLSREYYFPEEAAGNASGPGFLACWFCRIVPESRRAQLLIARPTMGHETNDLEWNVCLQGGETKTVLFF